MTKTKKIIIISIAVLLIAAIISVGIYFIVKKKQADDWAKLVQEYHDNKIATFEAENATVAPGETDVVFIGDSLTDSYDVQSYYPQYKVLNRGIGGDTTFGLERRLKISVYDVKPKCVVMLIGANNTDTMLENYENILRGFAENVPDTKVILVSLTSMSGSWGKNNALAAYNNVQIKLFAEKYGFEFVDLYTPLFDLESGGIRDEYTTDGGHLTPAGYEVFTKAVTPAIEKVLGG